MVRLFSASLWALRRVHRTGMGLLCLHVLAVPCARQVGCSMYGERTRACSSKGTLVLILPAGAGEGVEPSGLPGRLEYPT